MIKVKIVLLALPAVQLGLEQGLDCNMQDADLSDVLFDRAVLNGANLKNANLSRTIFRRFCLNLHLQKKQKR